MSGRVSESGVIGIGRVSEKVREDVSPDLLVVDESLERYIFE